ncbi:DUF4372 domain-containing protein [Evansella halocellulosilytica]|uniref:DUF4372 domain-containing protein n=1 Tax=Evansella halocellulosilytica TaxID=2011013 RepID=UPI00211BD9E1|nr:DUF4372 domain-containing protein [Evansella halocellulosilytica]
MDKNTIKTVLKEYIHPINEKVFSAMVDQMELDKYTKKLDCLTFTKVFIYAELLQIDSLKKISF